MIQLAYDIIVYLVLLGFFWVVLQLIQDVVKLWKAITDIQDQLKQILDIMLKEK